MAERVPFVNGYVPGWRSAAEMLRAGLGEPVVERWLVRELELEPVEVTRALTVARLHLAAA